MEEINIKRLHWCDQPHNYWYEHIIDFEPKSAHGSKHMFDIYSFTHIFWPLLLTLIAKKIFGTSIYVPIAIFIITTIFELYENIPENIIKYHRIEVDSSGESTYRGDSTINIIGDIIFNAIGIYIGYMYSDSVNLIILVLTFIVITSVVGIKYWTEFLRYTLEYFVELF